MDAEQRLAQHDLAPVRLLPAAGWIVLWREARLRAVARAVLLRRPLDRGGELVLPRVSQSEGHCQGVRPGHDREVLQGGYGEYRRGQLDTRLHAARSGRITGDVLPGSAHRQRRSPRKPQLLLAVDADRDRRLG